ncbi:MAG: glutathione peroxidase [Proteobacteria bacterium]|nr:glutathione peroxidase [Pseudomonadota bacterium]
MKVGILLTLLAFFSYGAKAQTSQKNAYQFSFSSVEGEVLNLSDYRGKVVLVVNTASKCGLTPQYKSLQQLYEKYRERGLVVIGVPSNDFGNQELSSEMKVKDFTQKEFKISFPLTSISKVSGEKAHPFYSWANNQAGFLGSPKWNFHKYLIDKNGNFVAWFSSSTDPMSEKITQKIEDLLE